jgi:hypothetical protein
MTGTHMWIARYGYGSIFINKFNDIIKGISNRFFFDKSDYYF